MRLPTPHLLLALALLGLGACRGTLELTPSDHATMLAERTLEAPDPAAPGPWEVGTFYYGSGEDLRRPEYRDSLTLRTARVDGSKLLDLGDDAEERREYWGFGPDSMPLNARVWYPARRRDGGPAAGAAEGGRFPLVLVVHGNHDMKDFSDPGYDYLGELLASRGFVLASVDMNFVNGGIRGENDARGWLLLEHLAAWRRFEDDPANPLRGRVDLDNVALIGHSRGGEAVAHAAAFNRLERYPDDATLTFDYGFPIRGIVAIAPVDGQYLPTSRKVPVHDVSYLVFHGSHDGDVTSFHGLRQYDRVSFTEEGGDGHFKAALYMYRANHGQWNTVWGAHDNGPRSGRILDLRYLIEPEAQRRFAEIYVTAFLESVLRGDHRWLPVFRDHRVLGDWLPETMYVARFQDDSFLRLAGFEEDIDVTSGARPGITLRGDSLATWKEDQLQLRSSNRTSTSASQENQAVWLGWNNRIEGADTARTGPPARFEVTLPAGAAAGWGLSRDASLQLLLAPTDRTPKPREDPDGVADGAPGEEADEEPGEASGRRADASRRGGAGGEGDRPPPLDLSVELEDAHGTVASLPLSRYGPVRRPLEVHISRRPDQERERFARLWELVLQGYTLPLGDFLDVEPALDPAALRHVRLVFDRSMAGEVVVDDIGFAWLDPAFWEAPTPRVQVAGGSGG